MLLVKTWARVAYSGSLRWPCSGYPAIRRIQPLRSLSTSETRTLKAPKIHAHHDRDQQPPSGRLCQYICQPR